MPNSRETVVWKYDSSQSSKYTIFLLNVIHFWAETWSHNNIIPRFPFSIFYRNLISHHLQRGESDGTAKAGKDYEPMQGELVFENNQIE